MCNMKKILITFGTRPEAIKMAPLVKALSEHPKFDCKVCVTAQHREMLDQVMRLFEITPNFDLDLMKPGQSLNQITADIITKIKPVYDEYQPELVLVHGDTITTFASSLAAYYQKINVGHVEAGLRTGDIYSPWPEEMNRKLTASIARYHFAPTETARDNLLNENIPLERISVTGNTVIDALLTAKDLITVRPEVERKLSSNFRFVNFDKRIILVTGHRRENFGAGFQNICEALARLAQSRQDIEIVFPVHLNPNVRDMVMHSLSDFKNIHLMAPLDYLPFVYIMMNADLILTDSGGIQEEAPALGKPVLVMRNVTERTEAIQAKTVKLVGTDPIKIYNNVCKLLDDFGHYQCMATAANPYGKGNSAELILKALEKHFEI